ncbi:MAG: hypothetical protein KKF58_05645 [Gammaproteobacteria bacterium]|nr:hypothetical protein [Gammaproteobacteria bacterium]
MKTNEVSFGGDLPSGYVGTNTREASEHPAAEWALETGFDAVQVDCTTAVVLKILDGKCKMSAGEMTAILTIYDVVHDMFPSMLGDAVHEAIRALRTQDSDAARERIHHLRVQAEAEIPKPVMKSYKAFLHDGLFG